MSGSLAGLVIGFTRPGERAQGLAERLEAAGAEPIGLPMQQIEAMQPMPAAPTLDGETLAVFTSVHAVEHALAAWPEWRPAQCAAIGGATAAALERAGLPVGLVPAEGANSEALLALPGLQELEGRRVILVTGVGGRDLLARTLSRRGAELHRVPVYRRVQAPIDNDALCQAVGRAHAWVVTNGEALQRLAETARSAGLHDLFRAQLVVPSGRVVEMAHSLGFEPTALVPERISDEGYVQALVRWRTTIQSQETMTDASSERSAPPTESDPPPARRSPVFAILVWLCLLGLAGAGAYGGWWLYQSQQALAADLREISQAQERADSLLSDDRSAHGELAAGLDDLAQQVRHADAAVVTLGQRLDSTEALITGLADSVQGGRRDLQLAGIEQLLLLASDRVQLASDTLGAIRALDAADERLAAMNDPRLFPVREAISVERAQLREQPRPDLTSAVLSLGSLITRADALPLAARTPTRFVHAELQPERHEGPWYSRLLAAVGEAWSSMYSVRREEAGVRRLVPAEDQALTVALLKLKLEGARAALIRGESAGFREMCSAAQQWLDAQFQRDDPAVLAVMTELQRLAALPVGAPLPPMGESLARLRAQIGPAD